LKFGVLDPYAYEMYFTAMQTKESDLQATRPVAVKRGDSSHTRYSYL